MCMGKPTTPPQALSRVCALDLFTGALGEVFHGERWEDIEPSAERAWQCLEAVLEDDWDHVRAQVRARFTAH